MHQQRKAEQVEERVYDDEKMKAVIDWLKKTATKDWFIKSKPCLVRKTNET